MAERGNNDLSICIEQKEDGEVLSRVTLEYPNMPNQAANLAQIAYIRGMLDTAGMLDEIRNGPAPVGKLATR